MSSGEGGGKTRQRFIEKTARAGFHDGGAKYRPDLVSYTLDTLALVWPEKAHAFTQVIVLGRQLTEVAAEGGLSERTVYRLLAGHQDNMGAEDWFLIILQLYREADSVYPNGADVLSQCFRSTNRAESEIDKCFRGFFLNILEAAAGVELNDICGSLPWRSHNIQKVLAWPCLADGPPLARSLLPGLMATLMAALKIEDRFRLAYLITLLADEPRVWQEALSVLNAGDCRSVAECGRIPHRMIAQAEDNARLLLNTQPPWAQYGLLALFACTPLSWERLCDSTSDQTLRLIPNSDKISRCSQLSLRAMG